MGLKDLIVTPIYFLLFSLLAYWVRPYVTTRTTKKYFLPALWLRFFGAIILGVIYQFYYDGGDTFNYFTHGSKWIWDAFLDDPRLGLSMLTEEGGERLPESFAYSQHIWYYRDIHSFFVVKLTAFFDLFTLHTYSATALFFAVFSFCGIWAMYTALIQKYPEASPFWLAIAVLFVPSTIFWGSGILKDTITLGALGFLTWSLIHIIDLKKRNWWVWTAFILSSLLIYSIKVYILVCYLPVVLVWIFWKNIIGISNLAVRLLVGPALLLLFLGLGYLALEAVTAQNEEYSLDNIARKAQITAYDIRYGWGARTGGEGGYTLGKLDGTWQSMVQLMPEAINVTLFRPYLWEVKNPLMLLSALESLLLLILTFWLLIVKKGFLVVSKDPFLMFCLIFTLMFAFAVGVSTYNFGTLMRYKIPAIMFFMLLLSANYKKK